MADLPLHQNGNPEPTPDLEMGSKDLDASPNAANLDIQVNTKRKKQVINLESSEQKLGLKEASAHKTGDSLANKQSKKNKIKKTQHKCQLCKANGKKTEMKKCSGCKHYTHLHCLDENEGKGKYICDKCRLSNLSQDSKTAKKQKKAEQKIQVAKATQKKIEKEKRKDESNKTLLKFKQKYPYYIGDGDKLRFPIEDKLLLIYRDYFEVNQNRILPTDHPLIPSQYLGDLLEIENFISSFGSQFAQDYNGEYRKSVLYLLLNCEGSDKTFERLLGAIIKIYLKDIFEKNKTENVKVLNDNSFFILLGTIGQARQLTSDYVAMTAPQIIRHLSYVPSMKNSFKDFQIPEKLNLKSKLKILVSLIEGLSEVDGFHDMVSRKSEKISEMTKDKADFVVKLKQNEAQALSNKEKLKEMLGKAKNPENVEQQAAIKDKNAIKQAEKAKKKTQKLTTEGEASQKVIKDFRTKIVKIARQIPFIMSEVLFLGQDRNNSQYYFFIREPHRIYVRFHSYLMDETKDFKIFQTKQKICQLLKTLNTKGVHEKRLYDSINNLIKEEIIRNLTLEDDLKENATNIEQPMGEIVYLETDKQFRLKLVDDILQIEKSFSDYLTSKNYRWAPEAKRQEFRFGFPYIEDIHAMKEQIRNMQESFLFVEVIREKQAKEDSDSNEELGEKQQNPNEKQTFRRKKPIRIWGINSERIKKFWVEYLESCVNYVGIWISVNIFKNYVDKYLEKKLEHIRQQQEKRNLQKQRQLRDKKLKQQRQREKEQRNLERLRSRDKPKLTLRRNRDYNSLDVPEDQSEEGVRTRRNLRPNLRTRSRPLTIDSDEQVVAQSDPSIEQESQNEDECAICHDIGEVICCDTCPKVYHLACLGMNETPDGNWSCVQCLYRINNERQTRSKARKLGQ